MCRLILVAGIKDDCGCRAVAVVAWMARCSPPTLINGSSKDPVELSVVCYPQLRKAASGQGAIERLHCSIQLATKTQGSKFGSKDVPSDAA